MKITVNLNLHDDFVLTCEVLHISFSEAIMCYAENVKLFEVTHDEKKVTKEFKASELFFCHYTYWCFSQGPKRNIKNHKLAMGMIGKVKELRESNDLLLNSPEYTNLINQLFNKLSLNYDAKKRINTRASK